jgi:hypothetical protein
MDLFQIITEVVIACNSLGHPLHELRERDRDYALQRGREAIPNMLKIMEES